MVFIRKELFAKKIEYFETKSKSKRKWCIIFTYRPPKYDKKVFFQELSKAISQAINKYDNILIAGDLNIDVSESKGLNDNHFSELIDTFNYFKTTRGTLLYVLPTNKPNSLQKIGVSETGLSDCQKWYLQFFAQLLLDSPPLNY